MTLPNFFIIGAPKCGTSSLYGWLSEHPDVCGALKKEPFFFMDSDSPLQGQISSQKNGLSAYSRLFPEDAARFHVRMEATTHYLYQEEALKEIPKITDAKVCIVLRDPAIRILSSFNYTRNNLARFEKKIDFDEYLQICRNRQSMYPTYINSQKSAYVLEHDIEYSKYVSYVERWMHAMGPKRLKVLIFENVMRDPAAAVNDLLKWLNVKPMPDAWRPAGHLNETRSIRYKQLHRVARKVGSTLGWMGPIKKALKNRYLSMQGGELRSVQTEDLSELRDQLNESVKELEMLLGHEPLWWRSGSNDNP